MKSASRQANEKARAKHALSENPLRFSPLPDTEYYRGGVTI